MIDKNIEATIFQHLLEFGEQVKRNGEFLLQEFGITPQQWLILLHLANDPNLPFFNQKDQRKAVLASELAGFFHVSRANMTHLLSALVEKGIIQQDKDLEDRRRKRYVLTQKGEDLIAGIQPLRRDANERLFAHFTPDEKTAFLDFMERCSRHLFLEIEQNKGRR